MGDEIKRRGSELLTYTEAKARKMDVPEPDPVSCEWCGSPLEPIGMTGFRGAFHWIGAEPCGCEGAAREREEQRRREELEEKSRLREAFVRCGVKRRFLDATVCHAGLSAYLDGFSDSPGVGLYICGPSRAGKTYAASAIAMAFCASGYRTIMTTSLSMLDAVKASFDGDAKRGIARFASCDVLIIDDIGKESANSWVMTTLFQIVNERYEAMRPTIVTSQYLPDELMRRMSRNGEKESAIAITERLKETCRLVHLPRRANVNLMEEVLRDA